MKKRYYIVIAALLFGASVAKAQDHIKLDLQKTIQLANGQFTGGIPYAEYVSFRLLGVSDLQGQSPAEPYFEYDSCRV